MRLLLALALPTWLLAPALLQVGFSILAMSLSLIYLVEVYLPDPRIAHLGDDSLIILGWVGMWGSLKILLLDRDLLQRWRRLYRRLAKSSIVVRGVEIGHDRPSTFPGDA